MRLITFYLKDYSADVVRMNNTVNSEIVIIDEAHSSTSGKDMAAVTKALGSYVDYESDACIFFIFIESKYSGMI